MLLRDPPSKSFFNSINQLLKLWPVFEIDAAKLAGKLQHKRMVTLVQLRFGPLVIGLRQANKVADICRLFETPARLRQIGNHRPAALRATLWLLKEASAGRLLRLEASAQLAAILEDGPRAIGLPDNVQRRRRLVRPRVWLVGITLRLGFRFLPWLWPEDFPPVRHLLLFFPE
jgi:hypothetical protein